MSVFTHARVQRAVVLTGVAAVALVGCGDQVSQTPAQRVNNATSNVFDAESLTVSVGLEFDDASRTAISTKLLEEQGAQEPGAPELSPAAIERLLDARIVSTVSTTDGSMLSEVDLTGAGMTAGVPPTNLSTSTSLVIEGKALVEMRQVEGIVYVRADLESLEQTLETPTLVDDLQESMTGAPPAITQATDALVAGGWVSLDTAELAQQLEELGAEDPSEGTAPTPDASAVTGAVQQFLDDATAVVTREIVVTEKGDDALTVKAPLDRILGGVTPSLKVLVTELASQTGMPVEEVDEGFDEDLAEAAQDLAGRTATVDVTLDGDRLSTVRMDLAQFMDDADRKDMQDDGVTSVPVVLELDDEGGVEAPKDAVALDLTAIMAEGFGVGSGTESVDPLEGMTAEDLGMTPEEFEAFKQEMGSDA